MRGEGVRPRVGPKERTSLGTRIDSLSLSRSLALLSRVVPCCTQLFIAGAAVPVALRAVALRGPPRGTTEPVLRWIYYIFEPMCAHINKKDLKNGRGRGLAPPPQGAGAGARGAALSRRISLVSPSPRRRRARACAAVLHNTPYRTPYRDVKRVPCPCEMGGDRETSAESREIERELWAHRGSGASVLYLPGLVPKQNQIL